MQDRNKRLLSGATSLAVCGLLAGVVVAAAAFPAVAVTGLAAKSGAEAFENLPADLRVQKPPQITYVYAGDGKTLLTQLYDENRQDIKLADVSPHMQKAIVAAEDTRFYEHKGVDMKGAARAFVANKASEGGGQQGASTLTMQYVRQSLQYNAKTAQEVLDATATTAQRKLREMRYALALEKKLSKQEILERYLNIAYFGHRAYGVSAAARVYFNKTAKELSLAEASLLAGLVQAPTIYDPLAKNTDGSGKKQAYERRDNYVLEQMVKLGYVPKAEAEAAKKQTFPAMVETVPSNGCVAVKQKDWGFFCDYMVQWWSNQEAFGKTQTERRDRLFRGGYTIITTLDPALQAAAQKSVTELLPANASNPLAMPLAAVQPGTGYVKAMAVNRHYSNDLTGNGTSTYPEKKAKGMKGSYPNTTNALVSGGGDIKGYHLGSTFKLFTTVTALEQGIPLDYTIDAKSPYKSSVYDGGGSADCPGTNKWCPKNASPSWMNGKRNMWDAFGRSVNTYFVPLAERVGMDNIITTAKKLGIRLSAEESAQHPNPKTDWGAFTLGNADVTPLDLAVAYAALAADGKYCAPTPVAELKNQDGKKENITPKCNQAVKPEVAQAAMDTARCPVGDQSFYGKCNGGTATGVKGIVGRAVAGKTGSTDGDKTSSMVVTTPDLAVASVIADPENPNNFVGGRASGGAGGTKPATAAAKTLAAGVKGLKVTDFKKPPLSVSQGKQVPIPDVKCKAVAEAESILKGAGFRTAVEAKPEASECPAGTVAKTNPSGQTSEGGFIDIIVSAGGVGIGPPPGVGPGPGPGQPGGPGSGTPCWPPQLCPTPRGER